MTTVTTMPTPTPLDLQWLQQQLHAALAPGEPVITLPRPTVELITCALATIASAQPPALATRYNIPPADLRPAVLAELQRLAIDGEAPSKGRWDMQRVRSLPSAQHICRLLPEGWPGLVAAAGLRTNPYARRYNSDASDDSSQPPAATSSPAARPPAHLQPEDYGGILQTTGSRVETVTAGAIRITRTYHTIR